MTLFVTHLKLDEHFFNILDIIRDISEPIIDFYPDWFIFLWHKVIAAIVIGIISIPIALGFLVAVTGINLTRLLPYINQNKKLKLDLETIGLYDKIVDFLTTHNIKHFELGDKFNDQLYKDFLEDEFGYGGK